MFSDIKKPPVRNSKEADAVVALRPHFPMGYHLAQQQVGGTSVLSNVVYSVRYFGENFNLLAETRRRKSKPKCVQTAGIDSDEVFDTMLKLAES